MPENEYKRKRRRFSVRQIIGIILIVVGLAIIAYDLVPQYMMSQTNKENLQIAQTISAEDIENNRNQTTENEESLVQDQLIDYDDVRILNPNDSLAASRETIDPSLIGGILYIPSVDISEPIYTSLTNETLMAGAAVMRSDQEMGQGNYPLAGHNTYGSLLGTGMYFSNLDGLEEGAVIRITDKKHIYEYVYTDYKLVHESQVDMVSDNQAQNYDAPIISLMRCEIVGLGPSENREFFIGELVNVSEYSEEAFYK